jgi:hypothetical protein
LTPGQSSADQRVDNVLPVANVSGGEAQELESSSEQHVLAAIVFDQAIAVTHPVKTTNSVGFARNRRLLGDD